MPVVNSERLVLGVVLEADSRATLAPQTID
jgi:hypothetical protein